jgi:predicted dehydrogenase
MTPALLKIALAGCGQIADAHLQEIRKIEGVEVVAVCDRQLDLARQAAARFQVPAVFADLQAMLEAARPDVLHLTTPPHTHAPLARQALAGGVHVYVEKPFALDALEAAELLRTALASRRLVCVGHDHLFDPVWEECRRRHTRGEFGRVIHVDSLLGFDLSGPFGRLFASEPEHWIHRLPGGLFQNSLSHAVYKVTEYLLDENPRVWATWFSRPAGGPPTELRVLLQGTEVTANVLFSSAAPSLQRLVRLYGTGPCVEVDLDGQVIRCSRPASLPGAFGKIQVPWRHFREAGRALGRNVGRFLRSDLHYFAGMNRLFRLFYRAVREGGEPPIPYREIQRVTAIMDTIFGACSGTAAVGMSGAGSGTDAGEGVEAPPLALA